MNYIMRYRQPAEDSHYGWENQSLPIGNGYLGGNVFGIVNRDRIQITENSLQNPGHTYPWNWDVGDLGGLNNFAEIYLHVDHGVEETRAVCDYERGLDLNNGLAYTQYRIGDASYRREYFASYPDRALVMRLEASKTFDCRVEAVIPYVKDYAKEPGDGGGKSGNVRCEGNRILLQGTMNYYNIHYAGVLAVLSDGNVIESVDGKTEAVVEEEQPVSGSLQVIGATEITICMTVGTNYELSPRVFLEEDPKKKLVDVQPDEEVLTRLEQVLDRGGKDKGGLGCTKQYEALKERHLADFRGLFGRVELELGEAEPSLDPTDELLARYRGGEEIPYLEALYFQYGRYMLLSSSREGTLPANLQGIWNVHDQAPWGSGYWHNINVQMNYWPAFVTNIAETFPAYAAFNEAFRLKAQQLAEEYIQTYNPESYEEGACGWTIGTQSYPYYISKPGSHSGPGTGGLTSKLFWEYYDFTRDERLLSRVSYPALRGMSEFLTKAVKDYGDGLYRASFSASPEQRINRGVPANGRYHQTIGCGFDQQMIWENGRDFLQAAEILGLQEDPLYQEQKSQIDRYHPIRIGWSGQIKEYEEENLYGEIGQYCHRHISQLVALHPGTLINSTTPAWLDAAKVTLTERGDESTGWALAHRLNAWARTGDGEHCHVLLQNLLGTRTLDNLWDTHPPFQIDGNLGGTAGIAEMLLQSHEGCIAILPSLPKAWAAQGHFKGLVARGAYEVEVYWQDGIAGEIVIRSKAGGLCKVRYPGLETAVVAGAEKVTAEKDMLSFDTEPGGVYRISHVKRWIRTQPPTGYTINRDTLAMSWNAELGVTYRIYRSYEDAPGYEPAGETVEGFWQDTFDWADKEYVMYRLTAQRPGEWESDGSVVTINHASELYLARYNIWLGERS